MNLSAVELWDVAVVGGGPAGAMSALVLARAGRRVLLVDASRGSSPAGGVVGAVGSLPEFKLPHELRTIGESLPAIAGHLLRKQGLEALLEGHRPAFGNVSAWGGDELVATDFIHDPHGLGWHLDRARFDRELRAHAVAAGAELRSQRVRNATRDPSGWTLQLDDDSLERAACVIDATGRRASIAKREGAKRERDDALIALYAWTNRVDLDPVASGERVGERTLVESVAEGWWYTAPLPQGRVVALHVDADTARRARREFAPRIAETRHVRDLLEPAALPRAGAGANPILRPHAMEACGARLSSFVGRGWVAVGDAALSFDPIAAQGIFNALYTGMRAGEAVDVALRGDPSALSLYSRRLEEIRAAYVTRRAHVYELETRFAASAFWRRRQER